MDRSKFYILGFILLLVFSRVNAFEACFAEIVDTEHRFSDCLEKAEQGDERAQNQVGLMYYFGTGTVQNHTQAFHWYQKSADQLNVDALYALGKIYPEGSLVPRDYLKAYTYLQTSLAIRIGWHHFGAGPPANIFAHRDQVAKNLTNNQIKKTKVDIQNSLREKGYELKSENGSNAFDLLLNAEMYSKYRTDQDYHAAQLYYYATEYGSIYASQLLMDRFQQGTRLVDYSSEESFKHYKDRAQDGDSREKLDLSYAYLHGYESQRSYLQALKWCLEAAKTREYDSELKRYVVQLHGKPDGINIVAMYLTAWMYDTTQGIPQDYKQAFDWYQKAADLGYGDAQLRLAEMYQQGQGVEQSNDLALQWYKTAAEQGHHKAQRIFADLYRTGTLVEQDKKQAFEWYKKAAVLEDLEAQYALAQMYAAGDGASKDIIKSYLFSHYLAEQYDNNNAIKLSEQLATEMTESQLSQAKKLGEQWRYDAKYRTLGVAVEL